MLILNSNKMICTLLSPNPVECNTGLNLQINNTTLDMHTHPKILDVALNPKFTCIKHSSQATNYTHTKIPLFNQLAAHLTLIFNICILKQIYYTPETSSITNQTKTISHTHYTLLQIIPLTNHTNLFNKFPCAFVSAS